MEHIWTVGQQVIVLFLLIGVGFLCGKCHVFGERAAKGITDLVLLFVTPCVIIQSFQRDRDPQLLTNLGIMVLITIVVHILSILLVTLVFRQKDEARRRVLRFGAVFSNCGYMALPLQQAVLGTEGVFYGAAYVALFNVFVWSWGLFEMSGDKKSLSARKLILNPGLIGVVIGLGLFLASVKLPEVVLSPISHLAALNTPLPMLVVGYHLACSPLSGVFKDKAGLLAMGLRLVVIPLLTLGGLYLCGVRGVMLSAVTIATSAPVAAVTTMFATKYGREVSLSVNMVSLSTLLSVVTMPLIVGLSQMLA